MSNTCKKTICEKSIYYYPSNHLSTKQMQSKMIQTRKPITYHNSRISVIYNTLLGLDYAQNRDLLLQYKYTLYTCYLSKLLGKVTQEVSLALSAMLEFLLSTLTQEEYNQVYEIVESTEDLPPDSIESGYTFYVMRRKLTNDTSSYFILKNILRDFAFLPSHTYTFDLSHRSNLGSCLSFSEDYSKLPYRGIEYTGTPGTPGSKLVLFIYPLTNTLYTFDKESEDAYAAGYSTPLIRVHENRFPLQDRGQIKKYKIRQYSNIAVYEDRGPRFSINDTVRPVVLRETNPFYYEITYGTYYLDIPKTYACALLNKGYEDCITFVGDADKCRTDTVQGLFLSPGLEEGDYPFYYGKVTMTVHKPFPIPMTLYSYSFGYMCGAGILRFVAPFKTEEPGIMNLNSNPNLYTKDILRFNSDNKNSLYGLSLGVYYVTIEPPNPVAFLNRGREDSFSVKGIGIEGIEGVSPDGFPCTYWGPGNIQIHVKDNFEKISMCTSSQEYSGGYKRLIYNTFYGAPSYLDRSLRTLYSQNTMNVLKDGFSFNQDDTPEVYTLGKGTYRIFHPKPYPIMLLNQGKESLIYLVTLQSAFTVEGLGPDGLSYTFYYGVFDLVVQGDFNEMSIYGLEMKQTVFPVVFRYN